MNVYSFNMNLIEIIDASSGNALTSFNRLKEQSGDIAVPSRYLELALNQDCYKTRRTKREDIKITVVENVDEVLKIALTKELKPTDWVEVDKISENKKSEKTQASIQ